MPQDTDEPEMVLAMRPPVAASVAQRHLMHGEGALPTGASRAEGRPDIPPGRRPRNPSLRSAALFLAALPLLAVSAAAEPVVAMLERVETCFVAPPDDIAADTGAYECGYVVVPENHAAPGDRMVRLGYVRLPARSGVSKAPFLMMAGVREVRSFSPISSGSSGMAFSARSGTTGTS